MSYKSLLKYNFWKQIDIEFHTHNCYSIFYDPNEMKIKEEINIYIYGFQPDISVIKNISSKAV